MKDRYVCPCFDLRKNKILPISPRINTNLQEDKVGGVSAEIRTGNFPNTSQKRYL